MTTATINNAAQQFADQTRAATDRYYAMIVAAVERGGQINFEPIIAAGGVAGFARHQIMGHLELLQRRKSACDKKREAAKLISESNELEKKFNSVSEQINALRAEFDAKCRELRGDLDYGTYQTKAQQLIYRAGSLESIANQILLETSPRNGGLAAGFGESMDWRRINL